MKFERYKIIGAKGRKKDFKSGSETQARTTEPLSPDQEATINSASRNKEGKPPTDFICVKKLGYPVMVNLAPAEPAKTDSEKRSVARRGQPSNQEK